jgi:hypothetical protein
MKFLSYVRALVHQWENGVITADDFVRLVRKAVIEEDAILDRIEYERKVAGLIFPTVE